MFLNNVYNDFFLFLSDGVTEKHDKLVISGSWMNNFGLFTREYFGSHRKGEKGCQRNNQDCGHNGYDDKRRECVKRLAPEDQSITET